MDQLFMNDDSTRNANYKKSAPLITFRNLLDVSLLTTPDEWHAILKIEMTYTQYLHTR